jgi:hypothetical protein
VSYNSSYFTNPDGSRTLNTSIPDVQAPTGDPNSPMTEFLKRLEERTSWVPERTQAPKPKLLGSRGANPRPSVADKSHNQSHWDKLEEAQAGLVKRAQMQAMLNPAPMRMTTFASGANNFYTPDVSNMSGIQREAYLPKAAGMENGGLSDGQIQGMSPAGTANSWNAQMAGNPDSVQNQARGRDLEAEVNQLRQLISQLQGRR